MFLAGARPDRHEEPRQDDHGVGQDEDRQQDAQTHLVVLRVSRRIMCWPLYRDCTIQLTIYRINKRAMALFNERPQLGALEDKSGVRFEISDVSDLDIPVW